MTSRPVSAPRNEYVNELAYIDLLGLDRVGRHDSTHGSGRVERTTVRKCPWECFSEHLE
jgi:hypothetical protein